MPTKFGRPGAGTWNPVLVTLLFFLLLAGAAGAVPIPDALTEQTAAQWGAAAQNATASVYDDNVRTHDGSWSVRFETNAPFDFWAWTPVARNGNWDLTGTGRLRFWVYAVNNNIGFQNQSPWIRVGSAGGYWQYQTDGDLLNEARDTWLSIAIPLSGDEVWRRTAVGTVTPADIDYIEIHADTWGAGFTLWFDGMEFVPTEGSLPPPANLAASGFRTTAYLTWDAAAAPGLVGYEVQRRVPGGFFATVKRVLSRASFTDSGLVPGQTYEYRVLGIDGTGRPLTRFSSVSQVTPSMSAEVLSTHKSLEILVAFYTAGYSPAEQARLTAGVRKGMAFYWRTSAGHLHLEPTWLFIDAALPASQWGPEVEADLRARGVQNHQFDLAYLIGQGLDGCLGGYMVFGSTCASLGTECGVPYPENDPGVDYTIAWTFTHEIHHAIELMEDVTGDATPEVLFCHFPWCYPDPLGGTGWHVDWGSHFNGIARETREYGDSWLTFPAPYNQIIECADCDQDGMPDEDARVWSDEARFGSDPLAPDTDGDGLSDQGEYSRYDFRSTDPRATDTDGDALRDGVDPEPLYRVSSYLPILTSTPLIDGLIETAWPLLTPGYYFTKNAEPFTLRSFAGWNEDGLYLAFESSRKLRFMVSIDGSGQDGRFESPVRHTQGATDTENPDNKHNHIGDSWGDGNHIYLAHGVSGVEVFGRAAISGAQVASTLVNGVYRTEVRIPVVLPGGAAYTWYPAGAQAPVVNGLTLAPGHVIGLNVTMSNYEGSGGEEFSGTWTSLFETHSYVDFELGSAADVPEWTETPEPGSGAVSPAASIGVGSPGLYFRNPYARGSEILLRIPGAGPCEVSVFDLLGRRVRTLPSATASGPDVRVAWDGTNESGRQAAPGVYYLRASGDRGRYQRKMVLLAP